MCAVEEGSLVPLEDSMIESAPISLLTLEVFQPVAGVLESFSLVSLFYQAIGKRGRERER